MTLRAACFFAAIAGFVSLSCEILWFRVYSYLTGGSPVTFGLLLGFYLAGLAVGADLSGRACAARASDSTTRRRTTLAAAAMVANILAYLTVPAIGWSATSPSRGWVSLAAVFVAAAAFGALLPLVSHLGIDADTRSGEKLSFVYAANIAGCVTGSLVTGFVMLQWMTTAQTATLIALLGLVLPASLFMAADSASKTRMPSLIGAAAIVIVAATPSLFGGLYEKLQFKDTYDGQRFARIVENRHGVVAVTDSGVTFGGGVYDGNVSTSLVRDPNGIERAYALSVLHPHPRNVLMVGLSTGAWAQVIANSPFVDSLTIVEINPGYLPLIAEYPAVASVLRNPRVRIVIDDGRRWLVRNPDRKFDVIVSNTTFHYRSNSTNLLSVEFMRLVRRHLRPGGVFYFNTTGSQDVMKTAFTEFPHGLRVINFVAVSDSAITVDEQRWRNLLIDYRIDGNPVIDQGDSMSARRFERIAVMPRTLREIPSSMGMESRESVLSRIPDARVVTDDNMLPEWRSLILYSARAQR